MSPPVPREAVIRSFFWPFSAEDIVFYFRSCGCAPMTAADLRARWAELRETNTPMRVAGERPVGGFPDCDRMRVAECVAAIPER